MLIDEFSTMPGMEQKKGRGSNPYGRKPNQWCDAPRILEERSADTPDGCRIWLAGCDANGYGRVKFPGEILAHRVAYRAHVGHVPKGMVVRHRCDNKRCVNPDHLQVGTYRDNTQDAFDRGRMPLGSKKHGAKLDEVKVRMIRALKDSGGFSQAEIARAFNVSTTTVCLLLQRKIWKHEP